MKPNFKPMSDACEDLYAHALNVKLMWQRQIVRPRGKGPEWAEGVATKAIADAQKILDDACAVIQRGE